MIFSDLMKAISKYCKPEQAVILFFEDGLIIKSEINTGIFESTNSLEPENPNFEEYYDCGFEVTEILNLPQKSKYDRLKIGSFFMISEYGEPSKIKGADETIIWQK